MTSKLPYLLNLVQFTLIRTLFSARRPGDDFDDAEEDENIDELDQQEVLSVE
jgi:hypothetical protein